MGLAPAPNPTTYVHNPHTWTDPLGLAPDGCPPKAGRDLAEAKATALREAGIPEGAEPFLVDDWVPATAPDWLGGKQLLDENYQPIFYREETYAHPNGQDIIVFQGH